MSTSTTLSLAMLWNLSLLVLLLVTEVSGTVQRLVDDHLVRLPFTKRVRQTNAKQILRADRARAAARFARFGITPNAKLVDPLILDSVTNVTADNSAVFYTVSVGIGSPATQC